MATNYCEVDGCGAELTPGTGSQGGLMICPACRACQYYWKGKGTEALKERREKLVFWKDRVDYMAPHIQRILRAARSKVQAAKDRVAASKQIDRRRSASMH